MDYVKQVEELNWDGLFPCYEKNFLPQDFTTQSLPPDAGIIIDNGSYECRAGWSNFPDPSLKFRSLVAKPKLSNISLETFVVGNDIFSFEPGKIHIKSPFEKNIITHFGTQEHIFDHIFTNLRVTDSSVDYPVIFTEPLCNLSVSRKNMNEMLFELYGVPKVCYGVDMLFSLYYNQSMFRQVNSSFNSLIISSSFQTTHIVPILNGKIDISKSRRISIGSEHSRDLLMKSLHLKFPDLKQKLTNELIQYIQENYTMTALDYEGQLKLLEKLFEEEQKKLREFELVSIFGSIEMLNKAYLNEQRNKEKNNSKFSYLAPYTNFVDYTTNRYYKENNLIRNLIMFERPRYMNVVIPTEEEIKAKQEQKKEQSKRLKEIMQKKREENFRKLQQELEILEQIAQKKEVDKFQFEEELTNNGFSSFEELQKQINKILGKLNSSNLTNKEKEIDVEKRWPLLSIPDEDLTTEQVKMKKIQKMQRNAYLSRMEKREQAQKEKEKIEQLKQKDPEKYLISVYRAKKEIIDRLEKYKQIRKDMANRHSKSNMKRMLTLAELGKDSTDSASASSSNEDNFGKKDEDWDIYREVSRHNLSDEENEDQQRLHEIEVQINEMDPDYYKNLQKYQYNFYRNNTTFSLGVDQFRGPELIFKPYIIGVEQAGIIEVITQIFKTLSAKEQEKLAENIFITGGNTMSPNIKERIVSELRMNLPVDTKINVSVASDPICDAWKGAKEFFCSGANKEFFTTREEYLEKGNDYFKEHCCSNIKVNTLHSKARPNLTELYSGNEKGSKKYKI